MGQRDTPHWQLQVEEWPHLSLLGFLYTTLLLESNIRPGSYIYELHTQRTFSLCFLFLYCLFHDAGEDCAYLGLPVLGPERGHLGEVGPHTSCRWRRWCLDWRRSRSRRGSATCTCPHSSTTCPRSPGIRILLLLLYDAQGISFSTISWNVYVEILHVLMKKLTRRLDHPAASDEERRSRLPEWRGLSSLPSAALHPHCSQHSPMNKYQQDQWLEYLWGQPE